MNEGSFLIENSFLIFEENKIFILFINFIFKECYGEVCLLFVVCRFIIYIFFYVFENGEVLKEEGIIVLKDFNFNEKVVIEIFFDFLNNSNG